MKKWLLSILVTFLVITAIATYFSDQVRAQILCNGSATCESSCTNIRTPSGCKTECSPFDTDCVECTGYKRVCDTNTITCGFDSVWGGACAADCTSVGGTLASANCSTATPPPPPPNRWACSGNSCSPSYTGYGSYGSCMTACNPPTPPPTPPPSATPYRWACSAYSCVVSATGPYSDYATCSINCVAPSPTPTPTTQCTSCGCPGVVCGCLDEHDCGDITAYDCCGGSCVPEGTSCCPSGDCETCVAKYESTYVWLRVISNENNQTVAWKGPKSVDTIANNNWSVSEANGGGMTGEYFNSYKPSYLDTPVAFDKTKNKVSMGMKVEIDGEPQWIADDDPDSFYTNECDEVEPLPGKPGNRAVIAENGTWSNHFCTGGYTYDVNGLYPALTNNYCSTKSEAKSPYYFMHAEGDPDLDCDSTPRIWPMPDPDGCVSGIMLPGGSKPTGDTVNKSAHENLVPILQYANGYYATASGKDWVTLPFDGYWTKTYMAWETYSNTDNLNTIIKLTPPTGYNCADVRWFNNLDGDIKEQTPFMLNNVDGTCTISFNPKEDGNFVVLEVNRNKTQSCTVQFESADNPGSLTTSVNTPNGFNVHAIGNTSEVIPPETETTRLWLSKSDFSQYTDLLPPGFTKSVESPPGSGNFIETNNVYSADGKYYYLFDPTKSGQSCKANTENSCSMTATLKPGDLNTGDYHFFCDNVDGSNKCSGNPVCTYNGGTTVCTTSIVDCAPDTLSPKDHGTASVLCTSSCNSCSLGGEPNVCGGPSCSPGANVVMTTVPPQLIKPDPVQEVTENLGSAIEYYFPISWSQPADTTNLDYYEYVVYKQNSFANPELAYNAGPSHPDVLFRASTAAGNLGFGSIPAPDASEYAMGLNLTAAVRATNSLYDVCTPGGIVYSGWDTKDFTLVGTVSGNIYDDPEDTGSTSTLVTNFPSTAEVIIRGVVPSFDIRRLVSGNTYTVPTIPYNHKAWTLPNFSAELAINNNDEANWFVCSDFSGQYNGGENCTISDIASPQADTDFFVKSFNLRFESWWQSWGGNVFGRTGIVSAIPDGNDSPCADSSDCHPHLVAADHAQSGVVDTQSAGVPVTESVEIQTGDDSRFSEQNAGGVNNPRATGQETGSVTIENYTYFLSGTSLQQAALTGATKTRDAFASDLAAGEDVGDSTKVIRYTDNLKLDLSTVDTTLTIPSGEKYVVFVENDLEILGPSNVADHGATDQDYLIRVNTGGYLAFIAGGNITFDSTIGYDDSDGSFDDAGVSTYNTPNVEGVYIASNRLIVESNGKKDFKFVGAGTFVGWNGVDLLRQFEGNTLLRKQLNNLSPTELFIHRADLVTNTPEFMMRPQLTWQEVR